MNHLSVCPSVYLPIYLSIHLSIYLSTYLPVCPAKHTFWRWHFPEKPSAVPPGLLTTSRLGCAIQPQHWFSSALAWCSLALRIFQKRGTWGSSTNIHKLQTLAKVAKVGWVCLILVGSVAASINFIKVTMISNIVSFKFSSADEVGVVEVRRSRSLSWPLVRTLCAAFIWMPMKCPW